MFRNRRRNAGMLVFCFLSFTLLRRHSGRHGGKHSNNNCSANATMDGKSSTWKMCVHYSTCSYNEYCKPDNRRHRLNLLKFDFTRCPSGWCNTSIIFLRWAQFLTLRTSDFTCRITSNDIMEGFGARFISIIIMLWRSLFALFCIVHLKFDIWNYIQPH